jgi:hypothetical protein
MERVTERGFMCCNVVMCVVVMVGGNGKGYRKGFYVRSQNFKQRRLATSCRSVRPLVHSSVCLK